MKRTILAAAFLSLTIAAPPTLLARQEVQNEGVQTRGAFFSTRPQGPGNAQNKAGGATKPKPGGTPGKTGKQSATKPKTGAVATKNTTAAAKDAGSVAPATNAIGLGYTLYMRDPNGDAVRVDPQREFSAGEGIRISLEANTDGYLYIFHTEDGREPQMLFPHNRLTNGENKISAHRLYQIPATVDDWFMFDERPAIERLFVVVTRAPLADVPTGAALLKHCEGRGEDCYWKPSASVWAQVEKGLNAPVVTTRTEEPAGKPQTTGEREALTRGIKLSKADPAPSILRINNSPAASLLVATIDLVHK